MTGTATLADRLRAMISAKQAGIDAAGRARGLAPLWHEATFTAGEILAVVGAEPDVDGPEGSGTADRMPATAGTVADAARLIAKHRDHAAEVSLKLGKVRELAEEWTQIEDGWGEPTPEAKAEAEHGRAVLAIVSAGSQADADETNEGKPVRWDSAVPPGGWVCAVPDPESALGYCGMPVESEPCTSHEKTGADGG